jgi:hypothetical protein
MFRQSTKSPQTELWARFNFLLLLMSKKRLASSLCRLQRLQIFLAQSVPVYRCRFSGDRFHFRKFHEQFFNLAVLMGLGEQDRYGQLQTACLV